MPKSKIRVKRDERIKMTFTVDECEGSLRGWGGRVNRGGNWRGAGRGRTGLDGSDAEKDPGSQHT